MVGNAKGSVNVAGGKAGGMRSMHSRACGRRRQAVPVMLPCAENACTAEKAMLSHFHEYRQIKIRLPQGRLGHGDTPSPPCLACLSFCRLSSLFFCRLPVLHQRPTILRWGFCRQAWRRLTKR